MYLNKVKDNNPAVLLVLLLAVFRDPSEKGCSKRLVNLIAKHLIRGEEENGSLYSAVFSNPAIRKVADDKNNYMRRIPELNTLSLDKKKSVRILLLEAINQPEFKSDIARLLFNVNIIKIMLDNPEKSLNSIVIFPSATLESRYKEISTYTALSSTDTEKVKLPSEITYQISFFLSRREICNLMVNRSTFYNSQAIAVEAKSILGL